MSLGLQAAAAAAIKSCGFDCSDEKQRLVDLLASALDGLLLLPFAFLFVWSAHRLSLNRWSFVTAALATVFALIASSLMHELIAPIFVLSDQVLEMVGLGRFWYLAMPAILICFGGALALARWCNRRKSSDVSI